MNKKEHLYILDLVRAIAIILICLNHAISIFYVDQISYQTFLNVSISSKIFMITSYILSRLGVPLFLCLTGALVLNKDFNVKGNTKKFYKKNLLTLLIAVEIWNIIYYFINLPLKNEAFNLIRLIKILLFMNNSVFGHMWYMPMILGIYIFIPYISIIVKKINIKQFLFPLAIIIYNYFIITTVNGIFDGLNISLRLKNIIPLSFMGAQYGIYIILGYYIYKASSKKKFEKKKLWYLLTAIFAFMLGCIHQIMLYHQHSSQIVYYNSFFILIFGLAVFAYLLCKKWKKNNIAIYLSTNSLAIYFIHYPLLKILGKYINLNFPRPIMVMLFLVASIGISIIFIEILKRSKYLKKYLLRQ